VTDDNDMHDLTESLARLQAQAMAKPLREADDEDRELAERELSMWERRIPKRLRHAQLADLPEPHASSIYDWLNESNGENLLLLGPVGVGKSFAGVAALRYAFDSGTNIMFVPVVEALDALRPGGPDDAAVGLRSVGMLLLDDLGVEKPSEWTAEQLYGIVNRRWLDERPTIVTSNLTVDKLAAALDPRLCSRLVHDALVIEMTGEDRRRS